MSGAFRSTIWQKDVTSGGEGECLLSLKSQIHGRREEKGLVLHQLGPPNREVSAKEGDPAGRKCPETGTQKKPRKPASSEMESLLTCLEFNCAVR